MASIEDLKLLLNGPVAHRLPDEDMDRLFSLMHEEHYAEGEAIIEEGSVNTNVYVLKEGIIRGLFDKGEDRETTIYFGVEGDYFLSTNSFLRDAPSLITLEACCDCSVLVVSRRALMYLYHVSRNFAGWALENCLCQILAYEMKPIRLKGDAYERYNAMTKVRPEITNNVPLKYIASYLGVTQQSLSRLRSPKYKK